MGQHSSLISIKNYVSRIETRDEQIFKISYHSLVEHIFLLQKVIKHPELTKQGPELENYIQDYCKRMAHGEMRTAEQQSKLSWQIEWIWHVHRLHPLHYLNDCEEQLSHGLVDTKARLLIEKPKKRRQSKMVFPVHSNPSLFVPSIDLSSAVIRQKDFLEKFEKHSLYSCDLQQLGELKFQNLVQDYVSFVKLAKKGQMIVPTFDIDLIWHTHMRYPSDYHAFSKAVCGFILDHDDSIESSILTDAFQSTANRWAQTYQTEYGMNVDRKHLITSRYRSSCAMVFAPVLIPTTAERPAPTTLLTVYGPTCAYVGGSVDVGDNAGGCGGAECGDDGGCGGGCGGD